jgi:hypothetical protein
MFFTPVLGIKPQHSHYIVQAGLEFTVAQADLELRILLPLPVLGLEAGATIPGKGCMFLFVTEYLVSLNVCTANVHAGYWNVTVYGRKHCYRLYTKLLNEATRWSSAIQNVTDTKAPIDTPTQQLIQDIKVREWSQK